MKLQVTCNIFVPKWAEDRNIPQNHTRSGVAYRHHRDRFRLPFGLIMKHSRFAVQVHQLPRLRAPMDQEKGHPSLGSV